MSKKSGCFRIVVVLSMALGLIFSGSSTAWAGVGKDIQKVYITKRAPKDVTENHRVIRAYAEQPIPSFCDFNWTYWADSDADPRTLTSRDGSDKYGNLSIAEQVYLQNVIGLDAATEYYIDLYGPTPTVSTSRFEDTTAGPICVEDVTTYEIAESEDGLTIIETITTYLYDITTITTYTVVESLYGASEKADNSYTLTLDKEGSGAITADPGPGDDGKYTSGQTVQLSAVADPGWVFNKWDIDGSNTLTSDPSMTMDANRKATAYFIEDAQPTGTYFTLTLDKEGSGSVTALPGSEENGFYASGSTVTLSASPENGWNFSKWVIGEETIATPETTITMGSDKTATAYFTKKSSTSGGGGSSGSSTAGRGASTPEPVTVNTEAPKSPGEAGTIIVLTIGSPKVLVNGQEVTIDAPPFIKPDVYRTMVPIRFISEQLGAQVEWLEKDKQVKISLDGAEIILTIGSDKALVNGKEDTIDCPAEIDHDRTYVPLRFIAETFGAEVEWDESNMTVTITK